MIKRIKSNIRMAEVEYASRNECTPYLDCSARDAARAKVQAAQAKLNQAQALRDSLKAELDNITNLANDYREIYDRVAACGPSVNSPAITGRLSGMIECACTYGSSVESSYNQCVSEVSRCNTELQKAQAKLAATPCVWRCS